MVYDYQNENKKKACSAHTAGSMSKPRRTIKSAQLKHEPNCLDLKLADLLQ
ncbi:hypothetical protein Hanom_Chr16g01497411 [Helianthus anomalus]